MNSLQRVLIRIIGLFMLVCVGLLTCAIFVPDSGLSSEDDNLIPSKGAPGENKAVKEDYPHEADYNESEGNDEFDDEDDDWKEEDDEEDHDEEDSRERDQRRTGRTALMYARECEKHLGPLPRFRFEDAVEIPTYRNGKRVVVTDANLWKILPKGDIPATFGAPFQLGNRVGRYQGKKKDGSPNPDVVFVSFYRDGGLGVIGHNMKTGATCFLSVEDGTDVREDVPTPNMPGYEKAWQSPSVVAKDGCANCHMADPFLHTPWIDQVRVANNPDETLVPLIAAADSPYFVIGEEFPAPPGRKPGEAHATIPKHLEGNKCVECHAPQCVPEFFNVKLDELKMSAPFHNLEKETRERWIKDRDAVREYCRSLNIRYFDQEESDSFADSLANLLLGAVASFNAADEEGQAASRNVRSAWTQSYKAGYVDSQGRYAGGSEILHLEGHKGKLYAANSYWMEPSNIWYGGKDPKTPWSQILRLDRPNGKWEVDLELGPNNLRVENLKSVTFGTDGAGNSLEKPVTLLIATAYSPNTQGADINVFVRDDDTGTWEKTVLLSGTGESGENNSTRCMTVYRDRVTGVDRLFLPVGLLGIFTGVYDADLPGKIRWDKTPESGRLDKRSLAIIEANDSLVYSSGTKIYRRNDGSSPTHSMIFDASQLSKGPVASPVGGVRGLSVIPNPNGPGESLLFVWAPDSRSRSCVIRLDRDDNGRYSHTKEECVADLMSEYLSGTPVYYALAGYNNILPVLNPTTKESAYLMGFECWVGGRQFPCWQGNERGGFYAGAMYAIRDENGQYWLNEVNGPASVEKSPLQSVRTYTVSPFESEDGKVIYFGGFVADHGPSPNTAWVYKTSVEYALRKDAPRPVRLTPEQSKAQLAALRQPYRFEYRDKPAFTIQIPGEFARGNATGGNVFHAKKAFNTLSISISQAEDPEQAAKHYVEALKRVGNGTAEIVEQSETELPDGTPVREFVATWVTKQNARQTTQALTACKDGHAVTIATHTWEVGLPDKSFFFTLKFETHENTEK